MATALTPTLLPAPPSGDAPPVDPAPFPAGRGCVRHCRGRGRGGAPSCGLHTAGATRLDAQFPAPLRSAPPASAVALTTTVAGGFSACNPVPVGVGRGGQVLGVPGLGLGLGLGGRVWQ